MADTNNLPKGNNTNTSDGAGGPPPVGGVSQTPAMSSRDNNASLASSSNDADSSSKASGVLGMVSSASGKVADEAGTRAKTFLSQGLERGSETLTNISTLIGDTVEQIEEKLGPQYGGYARSASETLNRYADRVAQKDPDELVDDARELIRKSPSVALGAAAVIGFGLVRLVKAGAEGAQTASKSLATPKNKDL